MGVVIAGRPVSRHLDDGWTLEITRLCTDGSKNVCSFLYSAAWRAARDLGYRHMITYILQSEPGTSLEASGWHLMDADCGGLNWSGCRKREHPDAEKKKRYEVWTKEYHKGEVVPRIEEAVNLDS